MGQKTEKFSPIVESFVVAFTCRSMSLPLIYAQAALRPRVKVIIVKGAIVAIL